MEKTNQKFHLKKPFPDDPNQPQPPNDPVEPQPPGDPIKQPVTDAKGSKN